jgi:hypothetical protein
MPEASFSDSSVRGCKTGLLLLVDTLRESEPGSDEGMARDVSVAGGAGAV